MTVTVLSPVLRLIWWPSVLVSASAGLMDAVALASVGVAETVVVAAAWATLAVYSVVVPEKAPMSMPASSRALSQALEGML